MSRTFNMVGGGGGKAILAVTVTNGTATSVTATKSGVSVSLTNSGGTWIAELPSFGIWAVTITDGTHSNTATVNATTAGLYAVSIYMPDVPIGYTQLEYIQGANPATNTYINTGIYPIATTRYTGIFSLLSNESSQVNVIYAFSSSPRITVGINANNNLFQYASGSGPLVYMSATNLNRHTFDALGKNITFDGVTYTLSSYSPVTSNTTAPLQIRCVDRNRLVRFYRASIYDSTGATLDRDYYPAIRNEDSAVGMYDITNDTFLSSSNLTAGPAV